MKQGTIPSFYQIMSQFRSMCQRELPGLDLTQNEVYVLMFLLRVPEADTAREISEFLGMSPSLVSRTLDSLREKKIVELIQDENDRRVHHIHLNPNNEKLTENVRRLDKKVLDSLLEGIDPEEVRVFEEVLKKILINIQKYRKEKNNERG